MKKYAIILGSLFLTIGFFGISLNSYSQDVRLSRQEKKEARKAQMMINYNIIDTLVNTRRFVVEANYLENQYGDKISVSSFLNFISINSPDVVLQTSTSDSRGFNGLGGVTAEGEIKNWEISRDLKNLSHMVKFHVLTGIGSYDVTMTISANNTVRASIKGLSRGELIYKGHIVTLENSGAFKGYNSI